PNGVAPPSLRNERTASGATTSWGRLRRFAYPGVTGRAQARRTSTFNPSIDTMAITAADVKRLREMTGVGMMDCKQALTEADGDFDKAVEILRKKGQKVAAKRAEREANEGLIVTALSADKKTGAIVEVNCETDFVARNDDFAAFAQQVAQLVLDQ